MCTKSWVVPRPLRPAADATRRLLTRLLFHDESLDRHLMRTQTQNAYTRISAVPAGVGNVVSAIFFSVGSAIFFYLFLKAAYIPRIVATWGVLASLVVGAAFIASLVLPQPAGPLLGIGGAPIGIAELSTGLWLLSRGIQPSEHVTTAGAEA
jgi:hypothetical protein